jgi:hypothetical protein
VVLGPGEYNVKYVSQMTNTVIAYPSMADSARGSSTVFIRGQLAQEVVLARKYLLVSFFKVSLFFVYC